MNWRCWFGRHAWRYQGRETLPTKYRDKFDVAPHFFPYTSYPIYVCERCGKRTNECLGVDAELVAQDIVAELLSERAGRVSVVEETPPLDRVGLLIEDV